MNINDLTETILQLQPDGQIWRFSVYGPATNQSTFASNVTWHDPNTSPIAWSDIQGKGNAGINIVALRELRFERDRLLQETDWYANSDVTMSNDMKTYRQALRDLPANTSDPTDITWPTKP